MQIIIGINGGSCSKAGEAVLQTDCDGFDSHILQVCIGGGIGRRWFRCTDVMTGEEPHKS